MMKLAYMIKHALQAVAFVSLLLMGGFFPRTAFAVSLDKAFPAIANRLMTDQVQQGDSAGAWPNEASFTGSIVAGMVHAYESISEDTCKISAELGGSYILRTAQGNFFGDEAYALTCLGEMASEPGDNMWGTAVQDFYNGIKAGYPDGTQGYIAAFAGVDEPSTAVFYVANHLVAAHSVNAADTEVWRQGLIGWLRFVDDSCQFPVMALGAATWALARTGPLDETPIDPVGEGAAYWNGKMLQDLPDLLLSHQVPDGQPGAGSFYWQLEHADDAPCGYTEDAIFATLGLVAAAQTYFDPSVESAILDARAALLGGVDSNGTVWEKLSQEGAVYCTYAGEMLQVLRALTLLPIRADINGDGLVDEADLQIVIDHWGLSGCGAPSWCEGADINRDGKVDGADIEILLSAWQK